MKLPCQKNDVMFLIWIDPVATAERRQLDAARDLQCARNLTVGWVVDETADRIVFATGTSTTGEMEVIAIPQSLIVERIYVAPKKKQKRNGEQPGGDQ